MAQTLGGPTIRDGELAVISPAGELTALAWITANRRHAVEDEELTVLEQEGRTKG